MATTTVNGIVTQVPYGLIRNIRQAATERVTVVVLDSARKARAVYVDAIFKNNGIPFYAGDTVKLLFTKGCQGASQVCDIITVNPSTGAESVASTKSFTAQLQKGVVIACSAINASTGVATVAVTYEVF